MRNVEPIDIPVLVLCGGLGTRFREQTEFRPKPMIEIGGRPILWHIMRTYAKHGFKRFILCLGYRGDVIRQYFLHYASMNSDFTVELAKNDLRMHTIDHTDDWSVTLAETGQYTMTGGRVARAAAKFLGKAEHFAVTYGDGVTDANLSEEFSFHLNHGRIGTVLGVNPPSRFGEIQLSGDEVLKFQEKPEFSEKWINGGFFFFRREFLQYLSDDPGCVLEQTPLVQLADDSGLSLFRHHGFWHCMDTQRDYDDLNRMWTDGTAPWKV
ncbi:glucose-1-phosphate cytidylyltransferase [Aeoliella sp.]|uniref:glucose-1-phosphate cytidylyltransferase n=1 Tax=Aeoliella sp. TaxID=2795800 RepID=UPI003CCC2DEC